MEISGLAQLVIDKNICAIQKHEEPCGLTRNNEMLEESIRLSPNEFVDFVEKNLCTETLEILSPFFENVALASQEAFARLKQMVPETASQMVLDDLELASKL